MATIKKRQIPIFFEHNLAKLVEFLKSRVYYGSLWNPAALFPEVSTKELSEALEKIQTAATGDAEQPTSGESGED